MSAQITIIGLGQIGASIGLALQEKQSSLRRVGFDKDPAVARAAESLGAVNQIKGLEAAVREADIVLLAVPLNAMRETLKRIGPALKEDALVMDTAPLKNPVMKWAQELIPIGRFYLGLVPALTADSLAETETGLKAARPDLFKRTVMVLDVPDGTPEPVLQLAVNFAKLLGAKPMLTDLTESDGLMTTAHILPQLAAAALLNATVDQPGWAEVRKLAGRPFVGVTGGMAYYDDPASLKLAALANPATVAHALDGVIAALQGLRDEVYAADEEGVGEYLARAFQARESWLNERGAAAWLSEGGEPADLPDVGEQVMQMFFGSRIADRNKRKKENRE